MDRSGSRIRVTRFRWIGRKTRRELIERYSVEIDIMTREMIATRIVAVLSVP